MSDFPIARRLTRPSPYRRQDPSRATDPTPTEKVNDGHSTPTRKSNAGRTPRKTSIKKNTQSAKPKKVTFSPEEEDEADDEAPKQATPTPSQRTSNVASLPSETSKETTPPHSATSARHSSSPTTLHPQLDVRGSVSNGRSMRQTPPVRSTPERQTSSSERASASSSESSSSTGSVRTPPLNSPRRAASSPKTPKRPAEEDDGSPSSKRRRSSGPFDSSSPEPEQQARPLGPRQSQEANKKYLSIDQADEILTTIAEVPRLLDLGEMTALFVRLQEKCFRFAERHFSFELTAEQQAAWPMHALGVEYYSLFRATQYLADASHCGWRDFFTRPEHRVPLIHGILGEWFRQRIFKIPGFGLSQTANDELAAIDREYVDYDGIVRNKKRAECLERLKQQGEDFAPAYFPDEYAHDVDIAATGLAGEIMKQIEPLLPPPVFDPLASTTRRSLSHLEKVQRDEIRHEAFMELIDLVKLMAGLSISIRMTGHDGTIVRLAPHFLKGSELHEDQRDDIICINGKYCQLTKPAQGPARLIIRMTCWARLEAVVPHGPDRLELETFQRNQQRNLPEGQEFRWEDYEDQVFPIFPVDLQETPEAAAAAAAADQPPGTKWGADLVQWTSARVKEHKYQDDDNNNSAPKPERGSSVTFYPRVAPPNVYCAWSSDVSRRPGATTQFPDLGGGDDRPHHRETLCEAVDAARRAQGLYVRLQDLGITSINTVRYYRPLEWIAALTLGGGLVGGAVAVAHRQGLIPNLTRQGLLPHFTGPGLLADSTRDGSGSGSNLAAHARHALGLSVAEARRLPSLLAGWLERAPQMASSAVQALVPAAATASTITLTATVTDWTTVDGATSTLTVPPADRAVFDTNDPDYVMIREGIDRDIARRRNPV